MYVNHTLIEQHIEHARARHTAAEKVDAREDMRFWAGAVFALERLVRFNAHPSGDTPAPSFSLPAVETAQAGRVN